MALLRDLAHGRGNESWGENYCMSKVLWNVAPVYKSNSGKAHGAKNPVYEIPCRVDS